MAIEAKRGCGFRKVGGIYLVSEPGGFSCGRLPIPLTVCPCCGAGIKQSRGWTWVDPVGLFSKHPCKAPAGYCGKCPAGQLDQLGDQAGLLWVGGSFYKTVDHFELEAKHLGISKRIATVPRGFVVGETWVLLAHPTAAKTWDEELEIEKECPGVFRIFKPVRIEMIITESMQNDEVLMKRLAKQNITPVIVPDDDLDHQGTVYDKGGDHE